MVTLLLIYSLLTIAFLPLYTRSSWDICLPLRVSGLPNRAVLSLLCGTLFFCSSSNRVLFWLAIARNQLWSSSVGAQGRIGVLSNDCLLFPNIAPGLSLLQLGMALAGHWFQFCPGGVGHTYIDFGRHWHGLVMAIRRDGTHQKNKQGAVV